VLTVRAALAEAAARLDAAGVADAAREAAWLLSHVMSTTAASLRLRGEAPLDGPTRERFWALVERRVRREPIQYVLGTEEFMGLTFTVTPAVLIPRRDTETLVEVALPLLRGPVRVADIGTGSGAIAVAIAKFRPDAAVVAVDISPEALAVARANAAAHGVGDRIDFREGDLLAPLVGEQFDAILSNPPYIGADEWPDLMPEVRDWEPKLALTPGPDDLLMYRRLAVGAPALLKPGGFLAVEVGYRQAGAVADLFAAVGLVTSTHLDAAGIERVVLGKRPV
jgi:release factor glutamine methyltransferase